METGPYGTSAEFSELRLRVKKRGGPRYVRGEPDLVERGRPGLATLRRAQGFQQAQVSSRNDERGTAQLALPPIPHHPYFLPAPVLRLASFRLVFTFVTVPVLR